MTKSTRFQQPVSRPRHVVCLSEDKSEELNMHGKTNGGKTKDSRKSEQRLPVGQLFRKQLQSRFVKRQKLPRREWYFVLTIINLHCEVFSLYSGGPRLTSEFRPVSLGTAFLFLEKLPSDETDLYVHLEAIMQGQKISKNNKNERKRK